MKYDLDKLRSGIPVETALAVMLGACNKPDTMFITERWVQPRLEKLRQLLSDPITAEQASALRDATLKRCSLNDVVDWLGQLSITWASYLQGKHWLQREKQGLEDDKRLQRREEIRRMQERENAEWERRRTTPWMAAKDDAALQARYAAHLPEAKEGLLSKARPCKKCGAAPDRLTWFWYSSPPSTWALLCGSAGWMTWCERCVQQVDFFIVMRN